MHGKTTIKKSDHINIQNNGYWSADYPRGYMRYSFVIFKMECVVLSA